MTAVALPDMKLPDMKLPDMKLPDISVSGLSMPELSMPDLDRLRLTELRDRISPRPRRWPRVVLGIGLVAIIGSGVMALIRSGALATAGDRIRLSLRRWAPTPSSQDARTEAGWEPVTVHPEPDADAWAPVEAPVEALR